MADAARIPGEPGVWFLILGDLFVFTIFFMVFVWYRSQQPDVFLAGRETLHLALGLLNTLVLLTSSLLVAVGVHRVRSGRPHSTRLFAGALGCGAIFVVIKLSEYAAKFDAGIGFTTSNFYMLYFAFTGVHLMHVLLGLGIVAVMRVGAKSARPNIMLIECGATFWHLVDLLWIILFSLFYLLG